MFTNGLFLKSDSVQECFDVFCVNQFYSEEIKVKLMVRFLVIKFSRFTYFLDQLSSVH